MPKITYIEINGTEHVVDVPAGATIMEGAINHLIPGIEGDCGGLCACGTCHVYVPVEWQATCGKPDELEQGMLEFAFNVEDDSRLCCQIEVTDEMEGMRIRMPARQY